MLTKKELLLLKEEMYTSKRPIIFFDDDTDGLSSFLLFYHAAKKNSEDVKGVIIKSSPVLRGEEFLRKIDEFSPDKVFILDKPLVDQDFLDRVKVPVFWLDHHPVQKNTKVTYFNPLKHKSVKFNPDNRPTTYWSYKVFEEDSNDLLWVAMVGCIGDWFVPEFSKIFSKKYPDLLSYDLVIKNPGTVLFESKLGQLCKIIQFSLKGDSQSAMNCAKILTRIKDPHEILDQTTSQGRFIYKRYAEINEVYERVKSQIKVDDADKLILFEYEDKYPLTSDLSNELLYYNPDKLIIIVRNNGGNKICSLRSSNLPVRTILEKALIGVSGHGGGHMHACGACVVASDFEQFIASIRLQLETVGPVSKDVAKTIKK